MPDGGLSPDLSSYGGYAGTNKLLATATNSPDVANQWAQNRVLNTEADTQQLDLARKKFAVLNDLSASIMANPTADNLSGRLNDAVHSGLITPQEAAATIQEAAPIANDPAKLRQWAADHNQTIAGYQDHLDAAYGKPALVDNGNSLTPYMVTQGPHGGYAPALGGTGAIPLQQRPDTLGDMVEVPNADGSKTMMTKAQAQQRAGYNPAGAGPYSDIANGRASVKNGRIVYNGATSAAGAPQATDAQGRAVNASGQPTAVAASPVAPWAGSLAGIPGPKPGTSEAANATATASAAMGNQLTKAADDATTRRATLSNLQDQAGKIVTGPGAERVNTLKAGVNAAADLTLGPNAGPRFDRATIAASEEFRKNAEILAQQQQQSLGGTDAALASGKASNPNIGLSTTGNKDILAMLQGNEDAIQAKNTAWQQWQRTKGSGSYPEFSDQFNKTFSPRAFQFAHMSVEGRNAAVKSMNPQDRAALGKALDYAERQGWIRPQ